MHRRKVQNDNSCRIKKERNVKTENREKDARTPTTPDAIEKKDQSTLLVSTMKSRFSELKKKNEMAA